jgi:hypothetical protein
MLFFPYPHIYHLSSSIICPELPSIFLSLAQSLVETELLWILDCCSGVHSGLLGQYLRPSILFSNRQPVSLS